MILIFIISFVSLISLLVLHEFGHFVLAKKFGVKVEEFGIGYPPRLFGKKIGDTIYSINLLPFGAFVAMPGEIGKREDLASFSAAKLRYRILIALGGVLSFWILAAIIFSIVMFIGAPTAVGDENIYNADNPKVQIVSVSKNSPAEKIGLRPGDIILKIKAKDTGFEEDITKTKQLQEFIDDNKGKDLVLTVERGKEIFDSSITPRLIPPEGEGAMGVGLMRIIIKRYPWYLAPLYGLKATGNLTVGVVSGWIEALSKVSQGVPAGVEVVGPVGIFTLFTQMGQLGATYFLQFIGIISVFMAVFNALPIPSADGGKLVFLAIEGIRKKPVPENVEQRITSFFFFLLVAIMMWVTIKDIRKIF